MNNILCYTITNFCPCADQCIELLYQSIKLNNKEDFDFIVLSSCDVPINFKINTIVDKNILYDKYIGFLKYSDLIPKNYKYYIYLDSDILYFGKLSYLLSDKHDFTITKENIHSNHEWFHYKYYNDKLKINNSYGINAGSFAFKDINLLYNIKKIYNNYIGLSPIDNAKLEQSSFNYLLALLSDFNIDKYYDISNICELHATTSLIEGKLLYHFCNFTQSLEFKYNNMKILYDKYTEQK